MTRLHFPFSIFLLFKKTPETESVLGRLVKNEEAETDFSRIRCPLCKWQPEKSSRWWCADTDFPEFFYESCGTSWNTFETGGRCPGCAHQWRWTTCLRCHENSLHADWYLTGEND